MESTFDNSEDSIIKEKLLIEESKLYFLNLELLLDDFLSNTIINGKNEIQQLLNDNRNSLIICLGSIKQNYDYFSNIREALDNILKKIEEVILLIYNFSTSRKEEVMSDCLQCLNKLFEVFIVLFQYNTSNSFLELFFNMFLKFLKKLEKMSPETQKTISRHFSHCYAKIYNILLKKQIEYIDKLRDSKISVTVIKIIYNILDKIDVDFYNEEIKLLDLFNFLFATKNNLFALSNDIYLEKASNLIVKIIKKIFTNAAMGLIPFNHEDDLIKITVILLTKMLEIGKFKDDLKNTIEYSHEIFYVNTLILCLRLTKLIIKWNADILSNSDIREKLTRNIIELSFWDSYSIVDYTCKLFELLWNKSLEKDRGMRSNFEKIIEYMFLRRYQSYYKFLGESDDSNIKLSTIEMITKYLNKMIQNSDFLIMCYLNYDFSKIRFNLLGEIFNSLQKYYALNHPRFFYLKKLITITYLLSFDQITKIKSGNEIVTQINFEFFKTHQSISDTWISIVKAINAGKYKKFYEKMVELFNLKVLDKKAELINESVEVQTEYKKVAKAIANLVKYTYNIDINIIYETISDNHCFSQLILEEYCNTFDFRGLDLLKAYEVYVSTFKLYGEPHNIYNFLMYFSKKYFQDNSEVEGCPFETEDQVSTLAYAILMLNTDLHNPNLTKHMLMEEFIINNRSTKLYDSFPAEYFKHIYKCISSNPLKVANSRTGDYTKTDEVFLVLRSKNYLCANKIENEKKQVEVEVEEKNSNANVFTQVYNYTDSSEKSSKQNDCFNLLNFPSINIYEDFSNNNLEHNSNLKTVYFLLWEDLYYNFMTMPYKFYELKDDNTLKVLEKVCLISQSFNQKENIDKLIMTLNSIINSGNFDKRNIVQLYNLFFYISINYSKNFHSYLEIYYEAILNIIKHKINDSSDLKHDYNSLINNLIEKTFNIIDSKRNKRTNSGGFLDYFFRGNSKQEGEFNIEQYRSIILNNIKVSSATKLNAEKENENNLGSDNLIEVSKILDLIKNQDEEFIFFVTLSASKILDYSSKTEFYFSLIFLNEILDSNLQEKEFIKIWQNLFNIFRSKMEFKHIFDKEENLFDILYTNYFLSEIMTRFCNVIEVEDYLALLENYSDVDNIEVLFFLMENNNRLIVSLKNNSHRKIIDKIFELNISLIYRIIEYYSGQIVKNKNNYALQKLYSSTHFLRNLFECVNDISILSNDSLNSINKILRCFYDNNFVMIFSEFMSNTTIIYEIIKMLYDKMINCLPKSDDEKWELFMFILEFSLKSSVNETEELQQKFIDLVILMLRSAKIPLLKYKEVVGIMTNYYNNFINVKNKYANFWVDVFRIFYCLLSNNEELFNSQNDIENLWNLFVKKFLISFVDYNKKTNKIEESLYKPELAKIFAFTINILKNMNEKPAWWVGGKNTVRLYFPDLVKDA